MRSRPARIAGSSRGASGAPDIADATPSRFRPRRVWPWLVAPGVLALALLGLHWASRPQQVAAFILARAGAALDLEITAQGAAEYRLRGAPLLVLHDVTARQPGADTALLRARRIYIALPWSTLRAGGAELVARRIEIDQPQLDLPALLRWQASRPPSEPRLPTLTEGLRIRDGVLAGAAWRIDGIDIEAPHLRPDRPLRARLRGRYRTTPLEVPFDLALALVKPEVLVKPGASGFAAYGRLDPEYTNQWRMRTTVRMSAPLLRSPDAWDLSPARIGMAATLDTGESTLPFALGAHGPLRLAAAGMRMEPVHLVLRGRGAGAADPIPTLDGEGEIALGERLQVRLAGRLAQWPRAWPALPPPVGQSDAPLPFLLAYAGAPALDDVASLELARDGARFAGRFRLPEMLAWMEAPDTGSPLPPLSGTLAAPRIDVAGTRLEGVSVEFDDETTR